MNQLLITPTGSVRCVYSEVLDWAQLGSVEIRRGSFLEPDALGSWWADLQPVGGPRLGPFGRRSDGLAAEQHWLENHWLHTHF